MRVKFLFEQARVVDAQFILGSRLVSNVDAHFRLRVQTGLQLSRAIQALITSFAMKSGTHKNSHWYEDDPVVRLLTVPYALPLGQERVQKRQLQTTENNPPDCSYCDYPRKEAPVLLSPLMIKRLT